MTEPTLSPVPLRHHRDATIARLCEHFTRDHLEMVELERLIDQAQRATTQAELESLVAGLPALTDPAPGAVSDEERPSRHPFEDQRFVVAVMGGVDRRGTALNARRINVAAVMGGVVLDFRGTPLPPGITEVNVLALMGGVEIIVPPGVAVDSHGIGIMGGFDHRGKSRFPVDSTPPTLRVTGVALMGGVEIKDAPTPDLHSGRPRSLGLSVKLGRTEPRDGADWPDSSR